MTRIWSDFILRTTRMLDNAWHAIDLTPPDHGPH